MTDPKKETEEYLQKSNINALLRWLTTELIIHRPNDPLLFISNRTDKIVTSDSYEYSSATLDALLQESRTKSKEEIDSETQLYSQQRTKKNTNNDIDNLLLIPEKKDLTRSEDSVNTDDFGNLVESMRKIAAELDVNQATKKIIDETCKLLNCERSTLYTIDTDTNEIVLQVGKDTESIRLPVGSGIAGTVAKAGKPEIIIDAYKDSRFDKSFDKQSGFITKSMLCCPLKDFNTGEVYGVIQAMNKKTDDNDIIGKFTIRDINLLETLGTQAVITLQNSIIYEIAATEHSRNNALLDLWRTLKSNSNMNSLLFTITRRCCEIVDAERCSFFLCDWQVNKLWSMQGEINVQLPLNSGLVGDCANSGNILNIPNVYNDERFDQTNDKKTGFHTKSMLCVPMLPSSKSHESKAIGVIQMINKKDDIFNEKDEELLELVLSVASPLFENSKSISVLKHEQSSFNENEKYVSDATITQNTSTKQSTAPTEELPVLAEEEDEEYEDDEEPESTEQQLKETETETEDQNNKIEQKVDQNDLTSNVNIEEEAE